VTMNEHGEMLPKILRNRREKGESAKTDL